MLSGPGRQILEFVLISSAGTLGFWLFQPFSVVGLVFGLAVGAAATLGRKRKVVARKVPKVVARKAPKNPE